MKDLAYFGRGPSLLSWPSALALLTLCVGAGCAGVKPGQTGSAGSGGAGAGNGGASGDGLTAGGDVGGDVGIGGSTNPDASACQTMDVKFVPQTPSVFILVDRSGSEFSSTPAIFDQLRPAVEQVVAQLDTQVRFGFGAFVGDHASGACELNFVQVPIALNNSGAIKAAYDPLEAISGKADTPMVQAIPMVQAALTADNQVAPGPKYMLVVTDSETDFCDDGNALCPADAVTGLIQQMFAATPSIGTLVIGLPSTESSIAASALQNFANAGTGQPVALPSGLNLMTATDVFNQCNGADNNQWNALLTAAGKASTSIATYTPTTVATGTAPVFTPASTATSDLVAQLSAALSGVKSCTFDLSTFKVNLQALQEAGVFLLDAAGDATPVPLDSANANGWDMTSPTELQLFGPACDAWRDPSKTDIKFNFPCDIIGPG